MYKVEFYEDVDGFSDVREFLFELNQKKDKVKTARIQYQQVARYIQELQENGTNLSNNVVKHIEDEIWELRPGRNRVFFFYYYNGTYILLHHYVKKSQKTPRKEIERAKSEMKDYIFRKGKNNDMGRI